jgi:L-ascorbate metabolism protein UlaG (beta-lactamase superfamily)
VQIEAGGKVFLFDPFITGNSLAEGVISPDELNPDVILITHAHGDHWGDAVSIAQRTGALVISNFDICMYLQHKHGYTHFHPMNTGGAYTFPDFKVKFTYARHSSVFPDGAAGGNPNGILLHVEDKTIYHAGDTDVFAEMAWIGEEENIDVAFLPIGDNFTMGPKSAIRAAKMLQPKCTIPTHFDTFPPIRVDSQAWKNEMEAQNLAAKVMRAGDSFDI